MRHFLLGAGCAVLATAAAVAPALAGFELVAPAPVAALPDAPPTVPAAALPPDASPVPASVTSTPLAPPGQPTRLEITIKGYGRDLPLHTALQQIVPAGVRTTIAPGVSPQIPVSWRGNGRPWRAVLDEALAPARLRAENEGTTLTISALAGGTVDPAPVTAASSSPPLAARALPPPAAPTPAAPAAAPAPVLEPPIPLATSASPLGPLDPEDAATTRDWVVLAGSTLYKTLESWSLALGYSPPEDQSGFEYPIDRGATFHGTYADALDWLMSGFLSTRHPPDWQFHKWTNVTVIVPKSHHASDRGGL